MGKIIKMSNDNNVPPTEPPERYVLDLKTLEDLAAVFTWAQMAVDTQLDDDTADWMQETMETLSHRLGLEQFKTDMVVTTIKEDDGSTSYNVKMELDHVPPKPALVWTNDQPNKKGLKIVDKDYDPDNEPDPPRTA